MLESFSRDLIQFWQVCYSCRRLYSKKKSCPESTSQRRAVVGYFYSVDKSSITKTCTASTRQTRSSFRFLPTFGDFFSIQRSRHKRGKTNRKNHPNNSQHLFFFPPRPCNIFLCIYFSFIASISRRLDGGRHVFLVLFVWLVFTRPTIRGQFREAIFSNGSPYLQRRRAEQDQRA